MATLTSHELEKRRLKPGDEVITAAAGFPTTVSAIVQLGAIPVFIDSELTTYNADFSQLEAALSSKTRAVIFAHTLIAKSIEEIGERERRGSPAVAVP